MSNEPFGNFDAKAWVDEWMKITKEHPGIPTDEGTMLAWFASAIMTGHDHAARKCDAEIARLRDALAKMREAADYWERSDGGARTELARLTKANAELLAFVRRCSNADGHRVTAPVMWEAEALVAKHGGGA